MTKYRKVVEVEAVRWTGTKESLLECEKFADRHLDVNGGEIVLGMYDYVPRGFYIIKEHDGLGFYKLHPRLFEQMYEEVK